MREGYKRTELCELPIDWQIAQLKEICEDITIGLVKTMTKHYVDIGVPLIRNSDIGENRINKSTLTYLNERFAAENEDKKLKTGDIVTVHTGDIGTSAVIDEELDGAHGFATLNTRVKKNIIDEHYLCMFFNSPLFKKQAFSFSTGDGRNNLNLKDFIQSLIAFPANISEQQKIVNILSAVDELIEQNEKLIQKTEELKKGITQRLFTKGIGHTQFKKTEIGVIPVEWEVKSLKDLSERILVGLATSVTGYYRESGVPIIRNQNIRPNRFDDSDMLYLDPKFAEGQKSKEVRKDDVITVHTGYIGISCLVPEEYDGAQTFTTLITTTQKDQLYPAFFMQHINSSVGVREVKGLAVGAGRNNLNVKEFKEYRIALPPMDEQIKIAEILSEIDGQTKQCEKKIRQLRNLKDGLAQQLLSGKMRVSLLL